MPPWLDRARRTPRIRHLTCAPKFSKESPMTAPLVHPPGRSVRRTLALVVGALALACGGAQAAPHGGGWHGGGGGWHGGGWHGHPGWHGGGHVVYRGGWGWDPLWPVGVGLGIGLATAPLWVD